MDYLIICIVALLGSALTLFSGFGLGTLLVPVFAIFFPIDIAIALTAIVHFLNNIFKIILLGNNANKNVVIWFGLPALIGAFIGAKALLYITAIQPLFHYSLFDKTFEVMLVKLIIAGLMIAFALIDLIPKFSNLSFDKKYLSLGGILSGFFGGLSGNQGALRSMFLIKAGLSKESYIATGVLIACLIDVSRITVYMKMFRELGSSMNYALLTAATLSAFSGAFFGNILMKKVTYKNIQTIVAVMLMFFSVLLAMGII